MKKIKIILITLFALTLCFIWGNSLLSPEMSSRISSAVGGFVSRLFGGSGDGGEAVGGLPIRKLAHLVEFSFLGALTVLLSRFISSREIRACAVITVGLLIPVIDETIQIFSSRGSSLSDVWIDVGGFALGCAVAFLIVFLVKKSEKKT